GEKMTSLSADPRVTFVAADDFALIPSYFTSPDLACPATQYYRAVLVRGHARVVDSREERALALQALMQKLQPQGGYVSITADSPLYAKSLDTTAVVAIPIEQWTAKFKFGQNLPKARRASVAEQLLERQQGRDVETVEAMAAACPFSDSPAS
ncbi:MAG: pyridoxamine 5'-phosphate oxidase family protein, partial [Dehalococcoidia bacterium]